MTRSDSNKTVGGSNLKLINAKSRDDCVHKGLKRVGRSSSVFGDLVGASTEVIYIDIYAVS